MPERGAADRVTRTRSLRALDLQSPTELERAEEITAATARAVAGEPGLRFRAHLLHLGGQPAPVRAPHVRPSVDTQTIHDLRGAADGIAMRRRWTDQATYLRHRPEGSLEDLLYEVLEQFRVEAMTPESTPGLRRNQARRFEAWSDECIAEGLLENHIGLLIFSTVHVCRSRILASPIEDRVNDFTESTRFGIYEVMGDHLLALRPLIGDQEAFARHAAAIATAIGELAEADPSRSGRRPAISSMLAMLALPQFDPVDDDGTAETAGSGRSRLGDGADYTVYSDAYDRTIAAGDIVLPHAQRAARAELDALIAEHRPLGALIRRGAQHLFAEREPTGWDSEQEEGLLDPRLLIGLATGSTAGRVYRLPTPQPRPRGAVSILIDCSGSMKSVAAQVAALIDLLVRALDDLEVRTEVLGYTTGAWNGGRPYREWLAAGRPHHPGRMNEAAHLVFKEAGTPWRRARGTIAGLLWTPMFREGLDGEALDWAVARLRRVDSPSRHLILISDGSPMDGATTLANGEAYLDRHLREVAEAVELAGDVRLGGLGIGHDLSAYMSRSRIVDPDRILEPETARDLLGFLAGSRP